MFIFQFLKAYKDMKTRYRWEIEAAKLQKDLWDLLETVISMHKAVVTKRQKKKADMKATFVAKLVNQTNSWQEVNIDFKVSKVKVALLITVDDLSTHINPTVG
jgi:hypothetical protein